MVLTGGCMSFPKFRSHLKIGRRHRTKLSRHGDVASEIGADLCVS
jgi:hypothetical protein